MYKVVTPGIGLLLGTGIWTARRGVQDFGTGNPDKWSIYFENKARAFEACRFLLMAAFLDAFQRCR
jgi:hypothetical protein